MTALRTIVRARAGGGSRRRPRRARVGGADRRGAGRRDLQDVHRPRRGRAMSSCLQAGEHRGPFASTRTLTLEGEPGAVLAGAGQRAASSPSRRRRPSCAA